MQLYRSAGQPDASPERARQIAHLKHPRRIGFVWIACLLACSGMSGFRAATAAPVRTVFLVPVSNTLSPADDMFLTAVPAAEVANGRPIVCAVSPESPWRPELLDYLRRYRPARVVWVGPGPTVAPPSGLSLQVVEAHTPTEGACRLAASYWRGSSRAVVYDPRDRASALAAAVLAARLRAPLFPTEAGALADPVRQCLARLRVTQLLAVGASTALPQPKDRFGVERLRDPLDVAKRLVRERLPVTYLAVTHALDGGTQPAPRVSLAAVLLAVERNGAVAPLPNETIWKRRFAAGEPLTKAPEGVRPSKSGYRAGTVDLGAVRRAFVLGQDAETSQWWAQFDLNGNGRFDGADEEPVRTGGVVPLGDRRYVVDLDVLENARGTAVWLTAPTPADIVEHIARYRGVIGAEPRYLCFVGWPEAVPLAITGDAQGIDTDLVTDHPYAQTDADPFVDVAFARFIAEDLPSATLQACRGLTLRDIRDPELAGRYGTAEWSDRATNANQFELAGLRCEGHHAGLSAIAEGSPLTRVGALFHDSHSYWLAIGSTYSWDTATLLSPCFVVSMGCSPASLDQDPGHRSVAAHLLRNGAVAFVGNGRRGIAECNLYFTEMLNALLRGETLGEAHRTALNRSMAAILEKGQQERGPYRYEQDHVAAYGDPALDLGLRIARGKHPARVLVRGSIAEVVAPPEIERVEYAPLQEWKCRFAKLWTWNGLGLGTEASWRGGDNYNVHDLLLTAEVTSRRPYVGVEPLDKPPAPLGWTGSCFVDKHADGTRTLYWRCRFVDFDQTTGRVRRQIGKLRFRLRTE